MLTRSGFSYEHDDDEDTFKLVETPIEREGSFFFISSPPPVIRKKRKTYKNSEEELEEEEQDPTPPPLTISSFLSFSYPYDLFSTITDKEDGEEDTSFYESIEEEYSLVSSITSDAYNSTSSEDDNDMEVITIEEEE